MPKKRATLKQEKEKGKGQTLQKVAAKGSGKGKAGGKRKAAEVVQEDEESEEDEEAELLRALRMSLDGRAGPVAAGGDDDDDSEGDNTDGPRGRQHHQKQQQRQRRRSRGHGSSSRPLHFLANRAACGERSGGEALGQRAATGLVAEWASGSSVLTQQRLFDRRAERACWLPASGGGSSGARLAVSSHGGDVVLSAPVGTEDWTTEWQQLVVGKGKGGAVLDLAFTSHDTLVTCGHDGAIRGECSGYAHRNSTILTNSNL